MKLRFLKMIRNIQVIFLMNLVMFNMVKTKLKNYIKKINQTCDKIKFKNIYYLMIGKNY